MDAFSDDIVGGIDDCPQIIESNNLDLSVNQQRASSNLSRSGNDPDMIDLTVDDDDDEIIEIHNEEGVNSEETIRLLNAQRDQNETNQEMEEENDDELIVEEVNKSEEEKQRTRRKVMKDLLDWFVKLKAEHITSFLCGNNDYYVNFISEKPFLDLEKCTKIAEDFKKCQDLSFLTEKWCLQNDDMLVFAICIGVIEMNNSLNIDFNLLSVDRIDDWSMKRCDILFEYSRLGAISKHGPLKFMQFTATTPSSALLLLTIVWLRENGVPCQFNPEDGPLDNKIQCMSSFELSNKIIDTSMKYWRLGKENTSFPDQMNKALDDLFHEIEATSAEIKDHYEITVGDQTEILKLVNEKMPVFEEKDLQDFTFLTQEQREALIKARAEMEALKAEETVLIKAANDVYKNKTDLAKKLVLNVGEFCLARATPRDEQEMTYAIVQERVDSTHYKVKFVDTQMVCKCNIRDIAFTRFGVMDPLFSSAGEVGLRVAVRRSRQLTTFDRKCCWVTGTTAGRRSCHRGDFLIFCDDGEDLYVTIPMKPEDNGYKLATSIAKPKITFQETIARMNASRIAVMVAQPLSKDGQIDKFLASFWIRQPSRASFVRTFMRDFPECPLLRMPLGMSIELRGVNDIKKSTVTVVGTDRAFAIVRHRNIQPYTPASNCLEYPCTVHKHYDERIYRGSHRLEGAAHKLGLLTANNNLSKRKKVQLASQFEPADMELSMPQRNGFIREKKRTFESNKAIDAKQNNRSEKEIEERKRKQQVFDKILVPTPVLPPKEDMKFHPQCGMDCLQKMDADPYDSRFHKNSPIHTPLLCGWRRSKYILSTGKKRAPFRKTIIYFAPCGKPLHNMASIAQYLRETRSQLTIDCFSFEDYLNTEIYVTVEQKYQKNADIALGQEGMPIPLVNTIDNDDPPPLQYTKRRFQYDASVNLSTINRDFCSGCSCLGDCSNSETCECQQLSREAVSRLPHHLQYDNNIKLEGTYNYRNLSSKVITGLYECNDQCSCNRNSCHNRVVQNNVKYPMHIFKTAESGWGCRALTDIPEGSFLCTYVGALLTNELADKLQNDDQYFADLDLQDTVEMAKGKEDLETDFGYGGEEDEADYSFDAGDDSGNEEDKPVSFRNDPTGMISSPRVTRQNKNKNEKENKCMTIDRTENQENKPEEIFKWDDYFDDTLYVVDAKVRGNLGRYLNHSCNPNVEVQHVLYDTHDLRLPWVAFFTLKHVKAGEELAWDYRYTDLDKDNVRIDCKCGADNCRRRLL